MPILSFLVMYIGRNKIVIDIASEKKTTTTSSDNRLFITYDTKTMFPIVTIQVTVEIQNLFYNETTQKEIMFTSADQNIDVEVASKRSGNVRYSVTSYVVYDVLRLFRKTYPTNKHASCVFVPNATDVSYRMQAEGLKDDSEHIIAQRAGNDPSDSFDVREYRPGDSLHRMHHKLSFKLHKPMIKEFESLVQPTTNIYVDLKGLDEEVEASISLFYGLSLYLAKDDIKHDVKWIAADGLHTYHVEDFQQVAYCLHMILSGSKEYEGSSSFSTTLREAQNQFFIHADGIQRSEQSIDEGGLAHA